MNIRKSIQRLKSYPSYFLYYDYFRFGRLKYNRKTLHEKLENNVSKPLTPSQKDNIKKVWKGLHPLTRDDWKWFEVYNMISNDNELPIEYYIPDRIWYNYVDLFLSRPRRSYMYDDKNMYDLYFHDIPRPKTICRKQHGLFLDCNYRLLSEQEAIELCKEAHKIIIKQNQFSVGGKGIQFWTNNVDSEDDLRQMLSTSDAIVQEIITQHEDIARLHHESINTVRIMTLIENNEVTVMSSVIRMGVGDSKVDNASSGGIVCGILPNGNLRTFAYNTRGDRFDVHHPQGCDFASVTIPKYDDCIELAKLLAMRMQGISELISWDFAIGPDGVPLLIECNLTYGEVDFHQMCNGPLFGTNMQQRFKRVAQVKSKVR